MKYIDLARSVTRTHVTQAQSESGAGRMEHTPLLPCVQCGRSNEPMMVECRIPANSVLSKERARNEGRHPRAEDVAWCSACWTVAL